MTRHRDTPGSALLISATIAAACVTAVTTLCPAQGRFRKPPDRQASTTQGTDWAALLDKAQNHRRIMLRRATARKVADAGSAAIPAVRAFEKKHGRNALRMVLVSSYAASKASDGATMQLLVEWAQDRDFYWRSQALQALANRRLPGLRDIFNAQLRDPSHLTRIQAGRGLCLLGAQDAMLHLLQDEDPRVRLRTACCLIEEGDNRGLPTLIEALRQDALFLDYPWGQIGSLVAFKKLRALAGKDFGFIPGEPVAKNQASIQGFDEWGRAQLGDGWIDPIQIPRDDRDYRGGVEIRSCRNGDLFLRWTADHALVVGLEGRTRVALDDEAFALLDSGPQTDSEPRHGKVICDFLRWICETPGKAQKAAPMALPAESFNWLQSLAEALDKKGAPGLAKRIRMRLEQFRSRRP